MMNKKSRVMATTVVIDDSEECKQFICDLVGLAGFCLVHVGGDLPDDAKDIDFKALGKGLLEFFSGREALIRQNDTLRDVFNSQGAKLDAALTRIKELEARA